MTIRTTAGVSVSIKKVEEEVHLTALDQKTKDEVLVKELAPYHQAVEKETEELKAKIKKIQCLSSIFYFSKMQLRPLRYSRKILKKFLTTNMLMT